MIDDKKPIISSSNLRQHNAITTAHYALSAIEQDVVYVLMSQIKEEDKQEKTYPIHIKEFEEILGIRDMKISYIKKIVAKLLNRVYIIKIDEHTSQFPLLAGYEYKPGSGIITFDIHKKIRPFFFALTGHYTLFQRKTAVGLSGKYAKRIYEMLCQFRNSKTQKMFIEVTELKKRLGLMTEDNQEINASYSDFNIFEKAVLRKAKKELDNRSELSFKYFVHKKLGRKVFQLGFELKEIGEQLLEKKEELIQVPNISQNIDLETKLRQLTLDPKLIKKALAKIPLDRIEIFIKEISKKANSIDNIGAYCTTLLQGWLRGTEPSFLQENNPIDPYKKNHTNSLSDKVNQQLISQENFKNLREMGIEQRMAYFINVKYPLEILQSAIEKVKGSSQGKDTDQILEMLYGFLDGTYEHVPNPVLNTNRDRNRLNTTNSINNILGQVIPKGKKTQLLIEESLDIKEKNKLWETLIVNLRIPDKEADIFIDTFSVKSLRDAINKVEKIIAEKNIPIETDHVGQLLRKSLNLE